MKINLDVDLTNDRAEPALTGAALLIDSLPSEQTARGPVETISLTWEQRSRARRRVTTSKGLEIALVLPRGTVLNDGMLVFNSEERTIQVIAELEDMVVVKPTNLRESCIIAHHLGNWHRSMQLEEDGAVIVEGDSPLITWLKQQQICFTHERRAFQPNLKGAAHD